MNNNRGKIISIYAAVITMLLGITGIIGCVTHNSQLRSIVPGTVTMKFNTALGFVFSSAFLLLYYFRGKNKTRYSFSIALPGVVFLIGLLTFAEYFFGFNIGIDEIFVKDDLRLITTYYAGRMSPLSAVNFILIGIGMFLLNKERTATYQFFYLSGIAFISLLMLIGFNFIADIPTFINLSIYDAIGFIMLSGAIYFAQPMLQKTISFEQKLFTNFTAVIILIMVLSIFSSYYSGKRTSTAQWVKHTNDVLNETEQILSLTKDIVGEGSGYIITGDSTYLHYFTIAKDNIFNHDKKLKALTKDDVSQRLRVDSLSVLIGERIGFSLQAIRAKNENGFEAAKELMAGGQGMSYTNAIRRVSAEIQLDENDLLIQRQKENNKSVVSFNRAFFVLLSSISVLLVTILFSIRRNITIKKIAAEKIKESEHMFSTLFYKSPDLKAIIEASTEKYIEVNDAFIDFLEDTKENILGKTLMEINNLSREEHDGIIKNIQKNSFVRELEMQIDSKDGKSSWVSTNIDTVNLNGKDCFLLAGIDITKRKITEDNLLTLSEELESVVLERTRELNSSEKSYRHLFENNPMPMWIIDLNTFKFLDVNEIAILQYGYSREDFLSMTTLDIRPDEDKELFKQPGHLLTMKSSNYDKGIWNHRKKDGTIIQAEIIAHKIIFEGVPARLVLSNDVTERKKAEEKLIKSEKLFRAMIENDADMKILTTHDGSVLYLSPSLTKILGYESQEFISKRAFELIHIEDIPEFIEGITDIMRTPGKSIYRQQRLKHKNGTWLWCEGTVTNMLHEPAVAALVSNFRDITVRKVTEEAIKLAETNYREIFDKASDGIYVQEIETGKVIQVNQRAIKITGYTKEELLNSDPQEFFTNKPDHTFQKLMNYLQKAAAGQPQLFEWMVVNKNGSVNWLEVNLKKATIAGKERILTFFREINDRKKAEMDIRGLNEDLEQKVLDRTEQLETVNKELEAFSYSVSHDLRTPLRAINGFAKMIGENYDTVFDIEGHRLFNRIKVNATKMGLLIDDLLEFSRLGRKEIHISYIPMTELAEEALLEINTAVNHGATVKIHQLHPVNADNSMLKQVMINLLSNAIKYSSKTDKPCVEITSYLGKNEIIYSVTDNGVGFNNQFVHKLFGVFQRLHLKTDFEGTGVGLALVKRIINKHGGRVWAVGELNKGATFCFSLPDTNNN